MSNDEQTMPIACNPQALSPTDWVAHQATTKQLFAELRQADEELPNGYNFSFPAAEFPLVAAFVAAERRCCPFFSFRIAVPPAGRSITLEITGSPEAKAIIAAQLLANRGEPGR